jgi:hypothetical protein
VSAEAEVLVEVLTLKIAPGGWRTMLNGGIVYDGSGATLAFGKIAEP